MDREYVSCPYIEGGLVFALGDLLLCCITNHGKGCPKACDFTGGSLPVEKIVSFREQVRKQNQQESRYPLCEGCGYLVRKEWEEASHLFNTITIAHFTRCNLRCKYCYATREGYHQQPYPSYDLYPVLESMLKEDHVSPDAYVFWGGGEPTICKNFEKTFDLLLDHGALQEIASDGIVLSKKLKAALQNGRARLICGVDAGTAETYKQVKGRDFFDRVWQNLAEYSKGAEGSVAAKFICMKENCHDVIPFLDRVQEAGVRNVHYDVNFYELEQPDEVVDAIGTMIYECSIKRGLHIFEGGSVVSFGDELRERINHRLNEMVNWEGFLEKQRETERLQLASERLQQSLNELQVQLKIREEALENLENSRTVRFTRELNKHPLFRKAALIGYALLVKAYPPMKRDRDG